MPPVKAVAKQIGASQKRLKPILDLVRGREVEDALNTLSLLPSPWARSVYKVVQSAASNAENNMFMNPGQPAHRADYRRPGPFHQTLSAPGPGAHRPHYQAFQPHHRRGG